MAITQRSIKLLWSNAGGRCSFSDCWQRLSFLKAAASAPFTIGEMAHIRGEKPGSNRHNVEQSDVERDDYINLILMCPTHHSLIDKSENEAVYSVEALEGMKAEHEKKVLARMEAGGQVEDVAKEILGLLEENKKSWENFGPLSPLARKEPHNEAAYQVWIDERLSTIVPNNRLIGDTIQRNRNLFPIEERSSIVLFLLHLRTYERWVDDQIPYSAVTRFPDAFEQMIKKISGVEN